MQKITSITNNQQGSVIIMAVIVLAMLSIIGIAATSTSTTEVQVSTNAMLHNIAFYTADSGIEAGRAALNNLKMADAGSWDVLLRNMATDPPGTEVITWNDVDCTTLNEIIDAFNAFKDPDIDDTIWQSDVVLGWLYESYNNAKKQEHKASKGKTEYD